MIRLFAVLLVLAMLIPGAALAEDTALPYLAVGAAPCQFDFDFRLYGTIWKFTSVGMDIQRVKMYSSYPEGLTLIYDQWLQSGEQRYLEEWNFSTPPSQYLIQTYDGNNFLSGEQWYTIPHCTSRIWIPSVKGQYVAS